jgi:hypothetical protein
MSLRLRHSSILSGIELTNVLISSISIPSQRSRIKLFTPCNVKASPSSQSLFESMLQHSPYVLNDVEVRGSG